MGRWVPDELIQKSLGGSNFSEGAATYSSVEKNEPHASSSSKFFDFRPALVKCPRNANHFLRQHLIADGEHRSNNWTNEAAAICAECGTYVITQSTAMARASYIAASCVLTLAGAFGQGVTCGNAIIATTSCALHAVQKLLLPLKTRPS